MPLIELTTTIDAPVERCFDLARSIDLHKLSTTGTDEEAIAGVTSGLIGMGEEVTWCARHFGIMQTLTSRITEFERPHRFRDDMIKGVFKSIKHDHLFYGSGGKTVMMDKFHFTSPGGILGVLFNQWFLTSYLRSVLTRRNEVIKRTAETDEWKRILN